MILLRTTNRDCTSISFYLYIFFLIIIHLFSSQQKHDITTLSRKITEVSVTFRVQRRFKKERLSENYLQVFNASSSIPSDGSDKMYYLHPECTSDDKTEMSGKNVTSDLDTSPSESNQEPQTGTHVLLLN